MLFQECKLTTFMQASSCLPTTQRALQHGPPSPILMPSCKLPPCSSEAMRCIPSTHAQEGQRSVSVFGVFLKESQGHLRTEPRMESTAFCQADGPLYTDTHTHTFSDSWLMFLLSDKTHHSRSSAKMSFSHTVWSDNVISCGLLVLIMIVLVFCLISKLVLRFIVLKVKGNNFVLVISC